MLVEQTGNRVVQSPRPAAGQTENEREAFLGGTFSDYDACESREGRGAGKAAGDALRPGAEGAGLRAVRDLPERTRPRQAPAPRAVGGPASARRSRRAQSLTAAAGRRRRAATRWPR